MDIWFRYFGIVLCIIGMVAIIANFVEPRLALSIPGGIVFGLGLGMTIGSLISDLKKS